LYCGSIVLASVSAFIVDAAAESLQLRMPVACEVGRTCYIQNYVDVDPSTSAKDYRCGTLTYDGHNGTDFRLPSLDTQQPTGDVLAAADGRVARVRDGVPDVAARGPATDAGRGVACGNGVLIEHSGDWETQYCHMARGSLQVKPGELVKAGQRLGRVGLSGLTEYSHLHFTVRHRGRVVDPFAYEAPAGSCDGGTSLWDPSLREQLAYQERTVLNVGFTTGAVTMDRIEDGEAARALPSPDAPAIVAFIRAIGLKDGDAQRLAVRNPAGQIIAENRPPPLAQNKAQVMLFAGKKRPSSGWDLGTYKATYVVERNGQVVLEKALELVLR
jgi:hypothetical protein